MTADAPAILKHPLDDLEYACPFGDQPEAARLGLTLLSAAASVTAASDDNTGALVVDGTCTVTVSTDGATQDAAVHASGGLDGVTYLITVVGTFTNGRVRALVVPFEVSGGAL